MSQLLFIAGLGGPELIVIFFIAGVPLILMLFCLVDIIRSDFKDSTTKLLWVLLVVLAPLIGSLLYLLFGRKQKGIL
ncbi:MAG TPA: PLDc N-terminal domain-containing protein [Sphingobacteriaceae bacterium]